MIFRGETSFLIGPVVKLVTAAINFAFHGSFERDGAKSIEIGTGPPVCISSTAQQGYCEEARLQ
jgi:hypothetical protein